MHLNHRKCLIAWLLLLTACESQESTPLDQEVEISVKPDIASHSDIIALENRAVGLMGQFDYDGAVAIYDQLVSLEPDSLDSRIDLAIALLNRRQEGDLARSERLLDEALSTNPQNLKAPYCRALLYFNNGNTQEALDLFLQVSKYDPTDSYSTYYIGQCLLSQEKFADAIAKFQSALEVDPYLRSAYYGAFQAAQRLGNKEEALLYLSQFQKLANNPRSRLAELKYTRMGPKSEVAALSEKPKKMTKIPAGDLFSAPEPLTITQPQPFKWVSSVVDLATPSITIADINADGQSDLFICRAFEVSEGSPLNAIFLQSNGKYELDSTNPLANVSEVNATLWGDYDNDGHVDVYICRNGQNQLWRQTETGLWNEVSQATNTGGGDRDSVDGACYDADHDGDLDFMFLNRDGGCELLNNNGNGTFQSISEELGIEDSDIKGRQVLVADLDGDDDTDIILLSRQTPHKVLLNDRLWEYHPADGFDDFRNADILAGVAIDANADGQVEIYTCGAGEVSRWEPDSAGQWLSSQISKLDHPTDEANLSLALYDFDGDSQLELIVRDGPRLRVLELDGTDRESLEAKSVIGPFAVMIGENGPEVIGFQPSASPLVWKNGPGRFPFARIRLSGRTDKSAEMRSNASGIGVRGAARIGSDWATLPPFRSHSGPGQNLQPYSIGLGEAEKIDFLRLVWPDGVSQSELDLRVDQLHDISETQRQAGSCPLLFVWNGKEFVFVADVLGAGGMGFNLGRGEYYDPRPNENVLLPLNSIQPMEDRLKVKLGEPMEEICYFDSIRLVSYNLPPEWQMVLDERFGAADPLPTGKPLFYRREYLPTQAINDRSEDIMAKILSADRKAAPLMRSDKRFIGLADPQSVTLYFDQPLDELLNPVFMFDGWVEYAYSQTAFAAWQSGIEYREPSIEARGDDGYWHVVIERFGYMAGTARRSTMPLDRERLPKNTRQLRISTNMQIYWDRLAVIDAEQCPKCERLGMTLLSAFVDDVGFSQRTFAGQRCPQYDYNARIPFGDTRHPAGFYTAFGDALELVERTDDAVAIIGPGEELHLEFSAPRVSALSGWTRYYVLECDGWCKDADLFTKDAGTVEPLPIREGPLTAEQAESSATIHQKYNTRFKSGW